MKSHMGKTYQAPNLKIRVPELQNQVFVMTQGADKYHYTASIVLPANAEATDKLYTFEVLVNDVKFEGGTPVTVKVKGKPAEVATYEVESAAAAPTELESAGGTSVVTVTFKKPADEE